MAFRICGKGFAPANGMVKLMGLTWTNPLPPTRTLTGMVTLLLLPDRNRTWPVKRPGTSPWFCRFWVMIPILTSEGAVPLGADTVSQLPPSDVNTWAVQLRVPVPALRICTFCEGGLTVWLPDWVTSA